MAFCDILEQSAYVCTYSHVLVHALTQSALVLKKTKKADYAAYVCMV